VWQTDTHTHTHTQRHTTTAYTALSKASRGKNPHLCERFRKALILPAWPADTSTPQAGDLKSGHNRMRRGHSCKYKLSACRWWSERAANRLGCTGNWICRFCHWIRQRAAQLSHFLRSVALPASCYSRFIQNLMTTCRSRPISYFNLTWSRWPRPGVFGHKPTTRNTWLGLLLEMRVYTRYTCRAISFVYTTLGLHVTKLHNIHEYHWNDESRCQEMNNKRIIVNSTK